MFYSSEPEDAKQVILDCVKKYLVVKLDVPEMVKLLEDLSVLVAHSKPLTREAIMDHIRSIGEENGLNC